MSSLGNVIGGLIGGAGGSTTPNSLGQMYPNSSTNATDYQNLVGQNLQNTSSLQNLVAPSAINTFNQTYNNPYASTFQNGANSAGSSLVGVGNTGLTNSNTLSNAGNQQIAAGQALSQYEFNPNSALYNQQSQQVNDQSNATNAQNGLTGPWAAEVANQNQQNFNNSWQSNQLQNAINALNGGNSSIAAGSNNLQNAQTVGQNAANDIYAGNGLSYNAANTITGNQTQDINNLIQSLGGINNVDSSTMQSLLSYLNQAGNYSLGAAGANQGAQKNDSSIGSNFGNFLTQAFPSTLAAF